jgi:hypothetical protein
MTYLIATFILLVIFQFKHLLADYYWQTPRMYLNKGQPTGWFWPLTEHAGVHALFTFMIIFGFVTSLTSYVITDVQLLAMTAAGFDFITHFATDRWKATRPGGPDTPKFWIYLGWDQMIHHLVGIVIVFGTITTINGLI